MTKAEQFDKAWRLAFKANDFSLVDEIYHPDYSAPDPFTGIVVNLEDDKVIVSTVREQYTIGYFRPIFESETFVCLHRFFWVKKRGCLYIHYQCDYLQRWKNIETGNSF